MFGLNYVLWDVTLIDGKGSEPLNHMAIAVQDRKIKWVERIESAKVSNDFKKVDVSGMTVMPGLIDAHVHLSGVKSDRVSAFTINPTIRAYKSLVQAQEMMVYGITAVRDISPLGLYLKRMTAKGEITGPRIVACGQGLTRSGGHADIPELPFTMVDNQHSWESNHYWGVFADGEVEIRKMIRLMLREGADQIKFWASGGGYSSVDRVADVHYTLEECRVIVEEAKLIPNMRVLAHAENLKSIENCIDVGVNSIEHGDELSEEAAEKMVKKGIFLVPTVNLVANWYLDRFGEKSVEATPISVDYGPFRMIDFMNPTEVDGIAVRDEMYGVFKMALEKGVKIALGSDTVRDLTTKYGEYTIKELLAMIEAGMTPLQAIEAATQTAADVLGLGDFIGSVEEGKFADLLIMDKNPAENPKILLEPSNIKYIIQDGKVKIESGKMLNFGVGFSRN